MLEIAPLAVAGIDLKLGDAPVSGSIRGLPVTLLPAAPLARWSLRARDPAVLSAAIGRALPERIGTHSDGIARLGPDEWYLLSPSPSGEGLGWGLSPGAEPSGEAPPPTPPLKGRGVSMVDVSARSVGFTLEGPGAAAALARGCPLDVAQFTPGRATRSVFETVEIQIWAMAPDRFHVEVWRSFAPWLWHALAEAIV